MSTINTMFNPLIDDDSSNSSASLRRQISVHSALVKTLNDMGFSAEFVEVAIAYTNSNNIEEILAFLIKGPIGWEHEFIPNENNRCEICKDISEEHVHNQILPPLNIQEKFEEVKNTQQRLSLRYSKELPSVDEEKCEICLSTLVFPWSHPDCGLHVFCMECVYKYLEVLINDSKVLHIKCPGDTCEIEFSDFDVKSLVTQEIYSKYLKFKARAELLADQSIRWCIRPDCEGFVRGSSNDKLKACPVCDFKICFQCGKAGHPKKSCEDVIDEDYELWARGREIQLCPKCKHRIEKIDGCNHMSCAVCGYNWCWLCRGHYTSNHFNAFNPFGCPNLQSGYNTRQQWPMWKIYLTRCRGFCLWICIVIFLPLVLLFGPAFHVTKAYHNDNIYDRSICKNLLLESFIFIGITIITPLGYACAVPFLVGYSVFKCIKYYCI